MTTLNIEQIKALLPHRYPFLLVDKVLEHEGDSLIAIKNVTFNEPCFQGHFPSSSVFPGVLIIEAMAQAAALLGLLIMDQSSESYSSAALYYLVGIDKARFKQTVSPGDQLTLGVKLIKRKKDIWKFAVTAFVSDTFIASADLITATIDG